MPRVFKAKISSLYFNCINSAFFFFAVLFFTLGIAFYYGFGSSAKTALIEQILHREQVIARSGANSIEFFFLLSGKSLVLLAQDKRIMKTDKETQAALDEFTGVWKNSPIQGIILVDVNGLVLFNTNISSQPDVGTVVNDRDYFLWAKAAKEGEVYVGTPAISRVGASKGKYIVPVATPLREGNKFKGLLAVSVTLKELAEGYLNPLKISDKTSVFVIDARGYFLSAPDDDLIGQSLDKYLDEHPFLGSTVLKQQIQEKLKVKGEGKLRMAWPAENLIAYSTINLDNQFLVLAVVTPVNDALVYIGPIYLRQNVGFVVSFLAVLMVVVRLAKIYAYKEAMKIKCPV